MRRRAAKILRALATRIDPSWPTVPPLSAAQLSIATRMSDERVREIRQAIRDQSRREGGGRAAI